MAEVVVAAAATIRGGTIKATGARAGVGTIRIGRIALHLAGKRLPMPGHRS
jgi:hypothetical protein